MSEIRFILLFFITLLFISDLSAQDQKLYGWESLQCRRSGKDVTITPNYIVYNTGVDLMFISRTDQNDITFMTKTDGLTESAIEKVIYNEATNSLLVYYSSGNIDIIDSNRKVFNFQDIKNNNTLARDKTINRLVSIGTNVYLCMAFGMVQFDMADRIFANTLTVAGGVYDLTNIGSTLYFTNDFNLCYIDQNSSANISFIGNWQKIPYPDGSKSYSLSNWKDTIVVALGNSVYQLSNNMLSPVKSFADITDIHLLRSNNDFLVAIGSRPDDNLANMHIINHAREDLAFDKSVINDNKNAVFTADALWLADSYHRFRNLDLQSFGAHWIDRNAYSPWSNAAFQIKYSPQALYVAAGGYSRIFLGSENKEGLFKYNFTEWTIYNQFTDPFFTTDLGIEDITTVDTRASDGELAMGSMHNGLIIDKDGVKTLYNSQNSPLIGITGDEGTERVADVKYDPDGNLWMAMNSIEPIAVKTPDNKIYNFSGPQNIQALIKMDFNPSSPYKWFTAPDNNAVVVYDPGTSIASSADDRSVVIPIYSEYENSNLEPTSIFSDSEGRIWVGTVSGVFTIDCGESVFDGTCEARYPLVQDATGLTPLLNGAEITAIAEDGAQRKWFGTKQGIFMTNKYGDEVLLHLTAENSPLASNIITALTIDIEKGNVYIGTTNGVQVYKTDASKGNPYHDATLTIYPNPVRPDYSGPIVIKGLAQNSNVKITDVNGRLVSETQSLGGQATWNGKDFNNQKVASGVYYIMATTTDFDTPRTVLGKIVFIK
jgi:hypothetical protein